MNAIPKPGSRGKKMQAIPGTVPSNPGMAQGCPFAPRCEFVMERCTMNPPALSNVSEAHLASCFLIGEPDN